MSIHATGLRTVVPPPRKEILITPELETREQQRDWVVIGPDGKINHFETSTAAQHFLDAEAEVCASDIKAKARTVYQELAERHGLVSARSIIEDRVKRGRKQDGLLDDPVLNRDRGWVGPFLVVDPSTSDGPRFRKLREWLPLGEVGDPRERTIEADIESLLEGPRANCTRFLSDEFAWDAISKSASRMRGHIVRPGVGGTLAQRIVAAAYDLEDSLLRQHPTLSEKSVADFWRSWQVHHHLANFASRIEEAEAPTNPVERHLLHGRLLAARDHVLEMLNIYSRETEAIARAHGALSASAALKAPRAKGLPAYLAAVEALVAGKSKLLQKEALAVGLYNWLKNELAKVKQVTRKDTRKTSSQLEAEFKDFEIWEALDDPAWRAREYKTKQAIAGNDFDVGKLAWALAAHKTGLDGIEEARTLRRYHAQLRAAGLSLPGVDEFR